MDKINQIIEELISLDPSFGSHRAELQKILQGVLSVKPDPVIDPEFVRSLRVQLLEHADNNQTVLGIWSKFKNNFMKKIIVSGAVAVVVLLAAVIGLERVNVNNKINNANISFGSDVRINHTDDGAFGSLATLSLATGLGGGGGGSAAAPTALGSKAVGMGGGGGGVADGKIAPYQPINYKYIYKGEDLNLGSDKLDVLKKQSPDASSFITSIDSLGLGLVNMGSFPGSKIQSVSLNQGNGYNLYVDLVGGNVSISGNYEMMPLAADGKLCTVNGCPQPAPIKEGDIPDDAQLISIANQFLTEHGISTSAYGDPFVQNAYRIQNYAILKANPKATVYWPDFIDVVYPLKVQDGEVYDESGQKMGLTVGVNIRNDKVSSVYNLSTQIYQASSYAAETNASRILKIAEQGGLYGGYVDNSPNAKTVEIDLDTPTMQYVSMWDYQNNVSGQLLVPSLVFPISNQPQDGSFYRPAVVVPLISDILNRYNTGGGVHILNEVAPAPAPVPESTK